MNDHEMLARHFETHRAHLRAVALRILGSADAAEEALRESQLRITHGDNGTNGNVPAWLTNVVTRTCLDMLRARDRGTPAATAAPRDGSLPESLPESWDESWDKAWNEVREELRDELWDDAHDEARGGAQDETRDVAGDDAAVHVEAIAESATLAMLVTLDRLSPAERLAFVLHDLLAVPFDEVAAAIGRSPHDAQRLAERARHTVQHREPPSGDHARRSQAIEAFLSAARTAGLGDVLDPEVVLRSDRTAAAAGVSTIRGAAEVGGALAGRASFARPALIDGAPGAVWASDGRPTLAFLFSVVGSRIVDIELVADPQRLAGMRFDLTDEQSS